MQPRQANVFVHDHSVSNQATADYCESYQGQDAVDSCWRESEKKCAVQGASRCAPPRSTAANEGTHRFLFSQADGSLQSALCNGPMLDDVNGVSFFSSFFLFFISALV